MLLRPGSSMFHADQPTSPVGSALEDYLGADGASKLRAALPQMKIANSAQQSLELSPGGDQAGLQCQNQPRAKPPASLQSSRVQAALRTPNCSQGVLGNLRLAELDVSIVS